MQMKGLKSLNLFSVFDSMYSKYKHNQYDSTVYKSVMIAFSLPR